MLRRILTMILALAILGYGTAWAFAGPGVDGRVHSHTAVHWTQPDADHPGTGCDHGCHASAHLVGLHQHTLTLALVGAERPVSVVDRSLASLAPAPPLKPPRP
jgi:hypothetical protein